MAVSLTFTYFLGRYLPPMTAFLTGPQLYTYVNYVYDDKTVFDDTILTYGTDYILVASNSYLCWRILRVPIKRFHVLQWASAALVASFAVASLAGAICHHFLYASLNTWYFRLLWRICVGSVGAAGGFLGLCGNELARIPLDSTTAPRFPLPRIPTFFWILWSVFFFGVIYVGLYSMRNPACDIFLTGVTQAPPTFYICVVLLARRSWSSIVAEKYVRLLAIGLLANCILLPGYDLLNYLNLPDGVRNLFLHTVLFCAWTAQGLSLREFIEGAEKAQESVDKAS